MDYAILGGGALGLHTAYRLASAGHAVMVFEQETTAGGLAAGFRVGDTWLEKFYHHLFKTDTTAIKLITELGLGERSGRVLGGAEVGNSARRSGHREGRRLQ